MSTNGLILIINILYLIKIKQKKGKLSVFLRSFMSYIRPIKEGL